MDEIFPTHRVAGGGSVMEFERVDYTLPKSFEYEGVLYDTETFLADTMTTGLLIMHDDQILIERDAHGHSATGRHIAWSVRKSLLSALFGIAVGEGHIRDIMQPVTDYLPELEGSGYDGVSIKDVLQMSSGVGFDENHGELNSDINRMGRELAMGEHAARVRGHARAGAIAGNRSALCQHRHPGPGLDPRARRRTESRRIHLERLRRPGSKTPLHLMPRI